MKISIAGTGYVGLVTGVCLASKGHQVICVEMDRNKIELLSSGKSPIFEPGIEELMTTYSSNLTYTNDYKTAYKGADVIFICVGTPERSDGYANLKYIYDVTDQIASSAEKSCTVVIKSTVPMGTSEKLEKLISCKKNRHIHIDVASNPEFLSQGTALKDFLYAQRIVFGVQNKQSETVLREVYSGFDQPIIVTDLYTAEMIKYASNNFLALKISFINEIANICELIGADVETVAYGMGLDKRIGEKFLQAGIGYGGSCFPKDTLALHWLAKYHDYEIKTVKAAIEVNENQRIRLVKKIRKYYKNLDGLKVAVLGLTFKPETDDLRESPSIMNINILLEEGAVVNVWDPVGMNNVKSIYSDKINYCSSIESAIAGTDICLILTDWNEVKSFDLIKYEQLMNKPIILDGRNCYDLSTVNSVNIIYDSIGRRCVTPNAN